VVNRSPAGRRQDYRWFGDITLRWNDIDVFGHVNNAQYYEFFDTTVVRFLHEIADAGIAAGGTAMVVAENGCRFLREIVFTDRLTMGLRVERLGTSSVRYGLAAFVNGEDEAVADGHFVHVFLDPQSKRPTPLVSMVREHLQTIFVSQQVPD
jgi:acyl-CoA thioester hydrolase